MLIDPFTVIAQIINFAILAIALKHFLYERVISAIDQREASIAARLNDARDREAVAHSEAEQLRDERARLDRDRHELLDTARAEVAGHRQQLLDQAREEVDDERRRWHRGLLAEQREFRRDLQRRTVQEVIALGRLALADLADIGLEEIVVDRALDRLENDENIRRAIFDVGESSPLTVKTAFMMPHTERHRITERLNELGMRPERQVRFERDPDLILGIELLGDGTAVSWNATDYVDHLAASLDELAERVDDDD